ncbi:hypothetical protein [Bacillus manliponensis]|uniref:hypothetical protein n=1 Tax=Bacillus manliponensis TaxID=574376 RepID=UPI0012FBB797|nr:hypothetical protein [Bacillus manliponensis]
MKAFKEQLQEWRKQSNQAKKKKRKEQLSRRDIESLIGIHGPRYERRHESYFLSITSFGASRFLTISLLTIPIKK